MIIYDRSSYCGYGQYFHIFGSAIFSIRCLPQALIAGALGYWTTLEADDWRTRVVNPTAYFAGISIVLGFLLVFRSQLAYNRYWEGRSHLQVLISKLEDVAIHTKTFVQAKDKLSNKWKQDMGHKLINYLALAVADLRGETSLDQIVQGYDLHMTAEEEEDMDKMRKFKYRTYLQMSLIVNSWVTRSLQPGQMGVSVSPPVQSRTYQIMSEAQLALNGAQKIQQTPFPFPMVQVCGMLLHMYMFSAPLVIGAYLPSHVFGTFLSAFSVLGLFALNKTAEELEDPFGTDPNDLPLDMLLMEFRESMFALGLVKIKKKPHWASIKNARSIGTFLTNATSNVTVENDGIAAEMMDRHETIDEDSDAESPRAVAPLTQSMELSPGSTTNANNVGGNKDQDFTQLDVLPSDGYTSTENAGENAKPTKSRKKWSKAKKKFNDVFAVYSPILSASIMEDGNPHVMKNRAFIHLS